jgi:dihydroorotate dehydrogenase (NAD+) catalytic subunit
LKPIALGAVFACSRETDLPIVGIGGVRTGRDVLEFLACGATHVALGTVLFADPGAPSRIRDELAEAAAQAGVATPDAAFRSAHDDSRSAVVKAENRSSR